MSFYDNSSLAFLPSSGAGKDGKAYSIKPTDGTGDFTFSRGSNLAATRVGPTGLIEKGRENLLLQSNTFSNASWLKELGASVTSGQSGYDGTNDAWQLDTDGTKFSRLRHFVSGSGVQTFSLYAKAGTLDWIGLYNGGGSGAAFFDLTNGVTGNLSSSNIDASITSVGGGWYRCEYSFNESITDFRIYPTGTNGTFTTTAGSIYIQDAQLEIGLAATDYIESGATTGKAGLLEDEPRFDYSGGATCPSLLLEPSRTNLLPYSEYMGGYATIRATLNLDSSQPSPTNDLGVYYLTATSANGLWYNTLSTSGNGVFSVYLKRKTGVGNVKLSVNGGVNYTNVSVTNEWKRFSISTTSGLGQLVINCETSGDEVYLWGLQAEQGSYPTSYIPNHSGGTITRGAEECIGSVNANNFNSEEGVLYAEVSLNLLTPNMYIQISDGTYSNRVAIINNNSSSIWRVFYRVNGVSQIDASESGLNTFETNKIAISWKLNEFKLYVNGVKITQVNSGSVNAANTFNRLEFKDVVGNNFYGNAKQVIVFPTALSDADLTTLTTL